jgi:serine protease Do
MSTSNILRRRRGVLLYSAALLASVVLSVALNASLTSAETAPIDPGTMASRNSFASIVAADKPAVVTITSIMKASPTANDETQPEESRRPRHRRKVRSHRRKARRH